MQHRYMVVIGSLVAGCSLSDSRTSVDQNELGVTAIETSRSAGVYELLGLGADGDTIASVRVRTGIVDGLAPAENDDHMGTEILTDVAGEQRTTITREMQRVHLAAQALPPKTATFVTLPEVSTALAAETPVVIDAAQASNEIALSVVQCPGNTLLTSPTAYQCCYDGQKSLFSHYNWDIASSSNYTATRYHNPNGTGCKASDGVSSCSGTACYYGPLGFSKASMTNSPGSSYYAHVYASGSCSSVWLQAVVSPSFANSSGSVTRNQGCPGGASAGYWDYPL